MLSYKEWEVKNLSRKLKDKNVQRSLVAHINPKSYVTEQYRLIRTNILFASVDKEIKSIAVTSSLPSEGKSTTAANLAIVMAQQNKSVLLVDADLRKPVINYTFNVSNIEGLTSVLTKQKKLEQVILKTSISNLNILTSGPIPPNPSELLNSDAMKKVINEMKNKFDYIIFDTPPALSVSDASILANECDGSVMVILSGKTKKEQALKTKTLIEKSNSHLLGVVLNEHGTGSTSSYYSY